MIEKPDFKLPRHVAIIMDGNGRWAKKRALPRPFGHRAGTEALRDIIQACVDWGIEALTVYAFSSENWSRPEDEVSALMGLILKYFKSEIKELNEKNACIRVIGDIDRMPESQKKAILDAMEITGKNTGLKLNIALNYGGKAEIVHAVKNIISKGIPAEDVTEQLIENELYTAGLPQCDLIIRTGSEQRLSNFLMWQSAYSEFVFNDILWPDYTRESFKNDLSVFAKRQRRFGGVGE